MTDTLKPTLLPCPFCGSPAQTFTGGSPGVYTVPYSTKYPEGRCRVHCSNGFLNGGPCSAVGPMKHTNPDAIAAWNTRHPDGAGQKAETAPTEVEAASEIAGQPQLSPSGWRVHDLASSSSATVCKAFGEREALIEALEKIIDDYADECDGFETFADCAPFLATRIRNALSRNNGNG